MIITELEVFDFYCNNEKVSQEQKNQHKVFKEYFHLSYLNFSYDNLMKHLYNISITYCMYKERKCGIK